jgi:hypothetical protein
MSEYSVCMEGFLLSSTSSLRSTVSNDLKMFLILASCAIYSGQIQMKLLDGLITREVYLSSSDRTS